jgi:hypothetical protein
VKLISVIVCGAALAGCSAAASQPSFLPAAPAESGGIPATEHPTQAKPQMEGYLYVSNRTKTGASELVVYPSGVSSRSPIAKVTKGLVDAGGVAVDALGNVYVANGSARNVLEFAPGGGSLVHTFSLGLVDPVDVAVANGTLYVADRGDASNGYAQQVFEYSTISTSANSVEAIGGVGDMTQRNAAVAIDPMSPNTFFASATSAAGMPPSAGCSGTSGSAYTVAENLFPTLWQEIPLAHDSLVTGVAFDSQGNLYASDLCANAVTVYAYKDYAFKYTRTVRGDFNAPFLLTINLGLLAVPSAATGSSAGHVTVIDLGQSEKPATFSSGLEHPIGASVGPRSS